MKKLLLSMLSLAALGIASSTSFAQIIAFEPNTNLGSEATISSSTTATGLNASTLSRGAGITASALANSFSSTAFDSATLALAVTANEYLQFAVSSQAMFQFSLSTLDVNFRRSSTGPDTFQFQYSLDGFATAGTNLGSAITFTNTTTNGVAQTQISLASITALQNVSGVATFRLFGYNATATTGTFAIGRLAGNDLAIGGSVSAVPAPEPTTAVMLLSGAGVLALVRRRRHA